MEVGILSRESFDDIREWNERYESGEFAVEGLLGSLLVSGTAQGLSGRLRTYGPSSSAPH